MKLYREGSCGIRGISGPLLFVENLDGVGCGCPVRIESASGTAAGRVLRVGQDVCAVQVFEGTDGLETGRTTVWVEDDAIKIGVGDTLRGRVLNGRGQPLDGGSLHDFEVILSMEGAPVNPLRRAAPSVPAETGISALDLPHTLLCGQTLTFFAPAGLPANELAARIAMQATVPGTDLTEEGRRFLVVFAAMGISRVEADGFMEAFQGPALQNGIFLLNTAGESAAERLLTPRAALAIAEYFAFAKGCDVLVVLTDLLSYCDALRESAAALGDPTDRWGYPLYIHSELAAVYERSGCLAGRPGSLTQVSVATVPDGDMTHPVAAGSARLSDARILLDPGLYERGVFPPVDIPGSRSRAPRRSMVRGRGAAAHAGLSARLYAACAKAGEAELLKRTVGDAGLNETERSYLRFAERFEREFLNQGEYRRTLAETENAALEILKELPAEA